MHELLLAAEIVLDYLGITFPAECMAMSGAGKGPRDRVYLTDETGLHSRIAPIVVALSRNGCFEEFGDQIFASLIHKGVLIVVAFTCRGASKVDPDKQIDTLLECF